MLRESDDKGPGRGRDKCDLAEGEGEGLEEFLGILVSRRVRKKKGKLRKGFGGIFLNKSGLNHVH